MKNLDRGWVLTCFGTAVGAGILFLPIQAGLSGVWSIVFLTFIIYPITYFSHRGITRIVASCPKETDIIGAIEYDLGYTMGLVISILYFLSIISICVGYATGLTNIINSFLTNQMYCVRLPRSLLTFVVLIIMTLIMLSSEKIMITITSIVTFPLIILLFMLSVYMIPKWNFSAFCQPFVIKNFVKNTLLLLPILIFAMNFSPVCSSLGTFYRKKYNDIDKAIIHSDSIVKWNSLILLFFVMFFVFSLFFSVTPDILINAKNNNVDILTAIALAYNNKILKYVSPVIAFLAIISSYFGHFTGTREGLSGIIIQIISWKHPEIKHKLNLKKIKLFSTLLLFVLLWFLAIYNPSILSIIGALAAPVIALYAYLMPVVLMKHIPRLRKYRSKLAFFIFVIGIFTIVGYYIEKII
ncbi:MAG: amino acid permease [Endomicrobium sp.]|nr:amino acid permease [Endomicrobium sp.]